ncbi:hypothetical protein CASFOL_035855 [Castilleja foliolosa]|uniref:ATP synthase F0 subunit 8 n=1 Tax=Castilleja foliolosa TaxID=1961234 RepID=A0ABD3BUN8_9LAMI
MATQDFIWNSSGLVFMIMYWLRNYAFQNTNSLKETFSI